MENVGHKTPRVGGRGLGEPRLQVKSKAQATTIAIEEPERREVVVHTHKKRFTLYLR